MATLKSWFGRRSNLNQGRRSPGRVDRRLRLESLEDRTVPSAVWLHPVANASGSGQAHVQFIHAEPTQVAFIGPIIVRTSPALAGLYPTHPGPTSNTPASPVVPTTPAPPAAIAPTHATPVPTAFVGPIIRKTPAVPPALPSQPASPDPNSGFFDFGGGGIVITAGSRIFDGAGFGTP
jgi:hypothetical protein